MRRRRWGKEEEVGEGGGGGGGSGEGSGRREGEARRSGKRRKGRGRGVGEGGGMRKTLQPHPFKSLQRIWKRLRGLKEDSVPEGDCTPPAIQVNYSRTTYTRA